MTVENQRNLTDIINTEAKSFAIYTVENRAIPNMIDGLKPSQRFVVHRALQMGRGDKNKFHKLASVAGGVADLGYHHGEASAQEAGALMANTWNNNLPILDGDGNFGSRLVQKAAHSRYIFCRISDNFRKYFKDHEVAPVHEDPEHVPPAFYLPVIPMVLINGVRGIGTGYATNILPHSIASVIECTKLAIEGKLDKNPIVSYPQFKGTVHEVAPNKYELHGVYKLISKTQLEISEIPYGFDRATYVEKILDPLEDENKISYDDKCGKHGFGFKVKLKKEFGLPENVEKQHDYIMEKFGLVERVGQFIYVLDENGKIKEFKNACELINHFVNVRKTYIQKRIEFKTKDIDDKLRLAVAKAAFIRKIIAGEIIVKGKTKQQLKDEIISLGNSFSPYVDDLLNMNVYHMTEDESNKLVESAKALKTELEYWKTTTVNIEYLKDLK